MFPFLQKLLKETIFFCLIFFLTIILPAKKIFMRPKLRGFLNLVLFYIKKAVFFAQKKHPIVAKTVFFRYM